MDHQRMSRRKFLARLGTTALGLGLAASLSSQIQADAEHVTRLPLVYNNAAYARVVRVHTESAAAWDYATSTWFGSYVDQSAVDEMMAAGLCTLTGASNAAEAWQILLPAYQPGQMIAVKVNFNNTSACSYTANRIDALIEPVNALISTLAARGVRPEDIYVYDAKRSIPEAFYSRRRFSQAHYLGNVAGCSGELATFGNMLPDLLVRFAQPKLAMPRYLTDLLHQATYVINMPIIKRHSSNPLTLGFKNHFGSLSELGGAAPDNPHLYISPTEYYEADKHPVVDIYANANIAQKTVLTVGDALFGGSAANAAPQPWATFSGRSPASLVFSRDPVAADCIMADLLNAEWPFPDHGYDYLRLANQRGLGVYEKGDPWHPAYASIDYRVIEL